MHDSQNNKPVLLEARDLFFEYEQGVNILAGVNLQAQVGKFKCLLGANGSGKTTLLRCLLGLLKTEPGMVKIDSQNLSRFSHRQLARLVAYVPQQPTFTNEMRAIDVVLTGRFAYTGLMGFATEDDLKVATLAMQMTESEQFAQRPVTELSGGEAQRVMIARALAQQPAFLLLDEPTSHLDLKHQISIYRMLSRVAKDWPMGVICVSHDVNLASHNADQLVFMKAGQIISQGSPGETLNAENLEKCFGIEVELLKNQAGLVVVSPR